MLRPIYLCLAVLAPSAAMALPACPPPEGERARVAEVDERLELVLDSGKRLRIWGLDVPQLAERAPAGGRRKLLDWIAAGPVTLRLLSAAPDRWGRFEAHVYGPRAGLPPLSVAEALIEAGLARLRPEAEDPECQQRLRGLEAYALQQGLGLWAEARWRPMAAADRRAFAGRAGEQVIVQGRVDSVNGTGYATYLNFGPVRTVDFSAVVRAPLRPQVEALLGPLEALAGRRLEVRGLLDGRFGPQIEIDLPTALQHLDETAGASPYSGREPRR